MRIAVDIDGLLTTETKGHDYKNRTPNCENIRYVNALYHKGHIIILYSSRFLRDRRVTKWWLKCWGIHYHKLVLRKLQYDILIDDKAINNFKQFDKKLI
jgi:uncharacterized HAD superfamily protein